MPRWISKEGGRYLVFVRTVWTFWLTMFLEMISCGRRCSEGDVAVEGMGIGIEELGSSENVMCFMVEDTSTLESTLESTAS